MIKALLLLISLTLAPVFAADILFSDSPQKVVEKPKKIIKTVKKVIKETPKVLQQPRPIVEKVTTFSQEETKQALFGKKMVIVVSSDEIEKAGMGITLGLSAAKKGADTTIVLGAKALKFALLSSQQDVFPAKKVTHRDILLKAIENGAHVQVCYMCAKALGLTEKDFIEGASVVKSLKIFEKMYEHGAQVLSF